MVKFAGYFRSGCFNVYNSLFPLTKQSVSYKGTDCFNMANKLFLYIGTNCSDTLKQSVQTYVNTLFRRLGTMCYASILLCFLYSSITCFLLCNICQRYTRHVVMK